MHLVIVVHRGGVGTHGMHLINNFIQHLDSNKFERSYPYI